MTINPLVDVEPPVAVTLLTSSASHPEPALQLCTETNCSEVHASVGNQSGRLKSGSTLLSIFALAPGRWTVAVMSGQRPSELTIKLHAGTSTIASREVALKWRRGKPDDTCHNWQTTGPIKMQAR